MYLHCRLFQGFQTMNTVKQTTRRQSSLFYYFIVIPAFACVLLSAPISASANQSAPPGYIFTYKMVGRYMSNLTYGQPSELNSIRKRLLSLCRFGKFRNAVAGDIIQDAGYAIAYVAPCVGSPPEYPEESYVLKKTGGVWRDVRKTNCGVGGGGVKADWGEGGVYHSLVNHCAIPVPVACTLATIRSKKYPEMDKMRGGPDKACLSVHR
jgi:hypothetical protein